MNERNQKRQAKKKMLEQKKLLIQMKQEIEQLEFEIKHTSCINIKIKAIRNLKIAGRVLQVASPYVLTAGIVAGAFSLSGNTPFYPGDENKVYSNVMTEFDNAGNIRYEQQYGSFENSDNKLYYYTRWQKKDDGLYSRIVKTYSINTKTYDDIMELFKKEDIKLEEALGEPDSNIKETKNNLTEDELQEESFVKAIIYSQDKNDYIICKETVSENITMSALYVLMTALAELLPLVRSAYSSFNFSDCIDKINRKHQPLDIDTLKKKLELKRDNYDRLIR